MDYHNFISLLISQTVLLKQSTKGQYWPRGLYRPFCICLGHYYQAFKIDPVCALCIVLFITSLCAVHYHNWCFCCVTTVAVWWWEKKSMLAGWTRKKEKKRNRLLNTSSFMNNRLCSSHMFLSVWVPCWNSPFFFFGLCVRVCLRRLDTWGLCWHFMVPTLGLWTFWVTLLSLI